MSSRVFFYGLFMDTDWLKTQGIQSSHVQMVRLPGHRLVIGERASLVSDAGASVCGLVMDLAPAELKQLYRAPSVADYQKKTVQVETAQGQRLAAAVYVLPEDRISGRNPEYAKQLAQLAKQLRLPEEYVAEINGWNDKG